MSAGSSLAHGQPGEHPRHRLGRVGAEVGVGHAGLLEVEDVEEAVAERRAHERAPAPSGPRGRSGTLIATTPVIAIGVEQRHLPDDHRAPVVADEGRLLGADVVEQAEQVVGEVVDVVGLDRLGPVGLAVAALVRGEHAVAGVGERGDLVAPRVRQLGEAVAEHDGRAVLGTGLHQVELDAVGRRPGAHGSTGGWWACGLPGRVRTAMTLPPHRAGAQTRAGGAVDADPRTPGVTLRSVHRRGGARTPLFAWREELGRLAALIGASRPRHRPAGARCLREEPRDLRLPGCGGHRPRGVRARRSSLVPPLVLWSAGLAVGWLAPRWRVFVHGASIGVLVGLAVVQLLVGAARPGGHRLAAVLGAGRLGAHRAGQGLPDVEPAAGGPRR